MITTTDKVHLKCDCVDGSIVNGIREQIVFSFNLSAPPGYKIIIITGIFQRNFTSFLFASGWVSVCYCLFFGGFHYF